MTCLLLVVTSGVISGCASALKEPPTAMQLAAQHETIGQPPLSAADVLVQAEFEMSQLPDSEAVGRALSLYLRAIGSDEAPLKAFLGAAGATAWLIEHIEDPTQREDLATEGVQISQLCRQQYPDAAECRYRLALAVGQQARERPSTGVDGLDVMVSLLEELIKEAPALDHAGPNRVLALVLLRAPGWPSGPGDPEYGLENSQAAVTLAPDYAPNHLALGEALAANGDTRAAVVALEHAVKLARESYENGGREAAEWTEQALKALEDLAGENY